VIQHASAFAEAVHRPHRAADIDAADAELRRGDRSDRTAAGQVVAVRVALIGNAGFLAPMDEARGGDTFGVVASVRVGFDHGAFLFTKTL